LVIGNLFSVFSLVFLVPWFSVPFSLQILKKNLGYQPRELGEIAMLMGDTDTEIRKF